MDYPGSVLKSAHLRIHFVCLFRLAFIALGPNPGGTNLHWAVYDGWSYR